VLMGTERRSMIISEEEKKDTAYHEAGHALVAKLIPGSDPIHKVTIIPRGHALGVTQQLPLDERHIYSKDHLITNITTLMGGRAAEELVLKRFTTGAGNDIEKATELARKMVCEWGMSDAMGPLTFGQKEEQIFLGREISQHRDYSETTAQEIDREVKKIVIECYERAAKILKKNIKVLHQLAQTLLTRESLSGEEIDQIIQVGATA
jgi:cell division protease FtsH